MIELELFLSLFAFAIGLVSAIVAYYYQRSEKEKTQEKTSEKFEELSNLLKTAGSRIKQMESEVEDKRRRVKELEKLKKELDGLVSLREEQVTAIRTELTSIMEKSTRKNRIWTITIGAIWFVIGLIVRGFLGF